MPMIHAEVVVPLPDFQPLRIIHEVLGERIVDLGELFDRLSFLGIIIGNVLS
jgi:hypothetical protein